MTTYATFPDPSIDSYSLGHAIDRIMKMAEGDLAELTGIEGRPVQREEVEAAMGRWLQRMVNEIVEDADDFLDGGRAPFSRVRFRDMVRAG